MKRGNHGKKIARSPKGRAVTTFHTGDVETSFTKSIAAQLAV